MKTKTLIAAALLPIAVLAMGCRQSEAPPTQVEITPEVRAAQLAQEILIIDAHIDLPYRLHDTPADVAVQTEDGHFDAVRARIGGLDVAFMSIYIPAKLQEEGGGRELADELIDLVENLQAQAPETFAVARSVNDVRNLFAADIFALPLGIENGAAIEDDLSALQHFYDRGVRYVTLTHSEPNLICDSSYAEDRRWNGLSPFGREVVAEMNRLGIMVDISHVTDDTMLQVLELSRTPLIASHSSCRFFTPGYERNISDDLITRVAERGGVIQIAFAPGFLNEEAEKQTTELYAMMRRFMAENDVVMGSPEFRARIDQFYEENPKVLTSVTDVADHIGHVVELVGIDYVGLGSDFDGITETPVGLEDVSAYPNLIAELLRRGYSEEDVRKICGENLLRVWSEVEQVAAELNQG
ncbi:MAG: dipeptidase [Thermoanaerobaculales bacterium]|nr:dipeptidase [Thermoanaerobaculales bacterium]